MNVVVTGATSFLGRALVDRLLIEKNQVFAVIRPGSKNIGSLAAEREGLVRIERNLEELHDLDQVIHEPCQAFYHFGWDGSGSENRMKREVQQKNVEDSLKALEGARRLGCKRFLFSGSQAEYGIHNDTMKEEMPCNPVSEYGRAKLEFLNRALELTENWKKTGVSEMEYIHTRIFSVYGPGDHPWSLVESCLKSFHKGEYISLGECTQIWNFLYLDDCIQALILLMEQEKESVSGVYNIAGRERENKPLREYIRTMYEVLGFHGSYSYGRRAPNAEGPANLIPDIKKLERATRMAAFGRFSRGDPADNPLESFGNKILTWRIFCGMRDRICIVCGRPLGETPLMTLADMPASAQDIPVKEELGEEQGITLSLHQCEACGLVQFDCEPVAYYKDVIRSGGFTTTMVDLRKSQYRHFIDSYHLEGKKLIEAGCGQGEFLGVLSDFPVKAYGIENRESLVRLAREKGLTVWKQFAAEGEILAADDGSADGPYDGFLSFNFLEHQPDPVGMLRCIADNLSEEGVGLITVPSLEYILQYDGYYELIRDHLAYYTFDTLRYAVEKAGFQVLEEEMINRDTLSVIVRKRKRTAEQPEDNRKHTPLDISGLKESLDTIGRELEDLADSLKSQGKTLGIWGASHQGFTLASTTVIGQFARYIIDSAPFKQGKYAPASHLPIVPPDHYHMDPVDAILIVAPGYTDEIAGIIQEKFGGHVEILALKSNHLERI